MVKAARSSIDASEVAKFTAMAEEWWDEGGKFRPLHLLNPTRLAYLRDTICAHFGKSTKSAASLKGISVLDIGCGGGLIAEPLARIGAAVTGIDASEKNIRIAQAHAAKTGTTLTYQAATAEALAAKGRKFDVVLALEIIEHVADVPLFLEACARLVKPVGLLFVATMNRTPKSYLFAIVGAEYVMRWLPRGTHEWKKFLRPSEIAAPLEALGFTLEDVTGVTYRPLNQSFELSRDTSVNYMLCARAPKSKKK